MFTVITRVPDAEKGDPGNLATALEVYVESEPPSEANGWMGRVQNLMSTPQGVLLVLGLRTPVFRLGEILRLNANDRDIFGRKPDKWDVDTEDFKTYDEAEARALQVLLEKDGA